MWRLAILLLTLLAPRAVAEVPARVVSMNLCTDQMALLIAAPGQLVSVSHVARDPLSSPLWREAAAVPANGASAEEIHLLRPDLVLAGEYDPPATLAMLERLGLRVERFMVERSFADVRENFRRMGRLLGAESRAEALVGELDASLPDKGAGAKPRALLYHAAGWTSGAETLADAILTAAGFRNVAAEAGLRGMAPFGLEALVVARPDVVIAGAPYGAPALAQEILRHPAVRAASGAGIVTVDQSLWVCGTPLLADAVRALRAVAP